MDSPIRDSIYADSRTSLLRTSACATWHVGCAWLRWDPATQFATTRVVQKVIENLVDTQLTLVYIGQKTNKTGPLAEEGEEAGSIA